MSETALAKVKQLNLKLGNQAAAGIDPDDQSFDAFFKQQFAALGAEDFLKNYVGTIIDAAAGQVSCVKFQSAFFEAHGTAGIHALHFGIKHAKDRGLVTLLDAKRCDIATTMHAYGRSAFDYFGADLLTVILYMGTSTLDALRPWLDQGRGVYVVLLSSNPEGAQLQNLPIASNNKTMALTLHQQILEWAAKHNYNDHIGFVLGATVLNNVDDSTRADLSKQPLLMPGLGAQGAPINAQLQQVYRAHRATLLPISRGLTASTSSFDPVRVGAVTSWPSFGGLVRDRIRSASKQLT